MKQGFRRLMPGLLLASGMGAALAAIAERNKSRVFGDENIRRAINDYGAMTGWTQRSRGKQAKPKKHRNMLTVSKRVRRKHRRAA